MPLYGIIGYPLLHTSSQAYFLEKFKREEIPDCDYQVFPLKDISDFPRLLKQYPQLEGLNVTIPHKEGVLQYVHYKDAVAEACGAANCLRIRGGEITAFNTDAIAFEESLKPLLQPHHMQALILGTGGAAKAVAWVLQRLGIHFYYVSRNPKKDASNTIGYADVTAEILRTHPLVINASPAGMLPHADTFPPISYDALTPQHLLYDLVYLPEKTLFLQKGAAQGAVTRNGYEMLILQAEAGWKIWRQK